MHRFSRRQLLGGAALLGVGLAARRADRYSAFGLDVAARERTDDHILVVLQLSGGNDGLNTVIPASAGLYRQYAAARPTLALPQHTLLTLGSGGAAVEVGLHPALRPLMTYWERGQVGIVQNVGYPDPNYSHFRSMQIWQTGDPVNASGEGWLAHALEHEQRAPGVIAASLGLSVPRALTGQAPLGISVDTLEEFQLSPVTDAVDGEAVRALIAHFTGAYAADSPRQHAAQTLALTVDATRKVTQATRAYSAAVPYPETDLARHLQLTARLIDANLGGRVYYVAMDGFDTHENQRGGDAETVGHDALMRDLAEAVSAFLADVAAHGHAERVLLVAFSEFGRRVAENGSAGTDHGSAGPMLVIGPAVAGGLYGAPPVLDPDRLIDDGNLPVAVDFRAVYATLLDRWIGAPSEAVLGATFVPIPLLRT